VSIDSTDRRRTNGNEMSEVNQLILNTGLKSVTKKVEHHFGLEAYGQYDKVET
jgi:hypothetical protein